ncbi:NAD(P)/FAD-dependent oxidoreductase [Amphritea balenae]|uniref:NAD(P)/FAD-dependent oxidoreductase n=1 Tax=Amphritea balenae TaxID=452629 RepID=A0A3P1SWD1_9GAMM|nr:FAD-dependent oxidoreductase [Amphritea balenae]RRD01338.1 NAD(P)/FAD-dependent oxidoreductase [Amphritea balenae]GGK57958.1 hypothetical protein GCM10007941_05130 [Amphritea balenae]
MTKPHLIIIGNGMASGRLLDEILKRNSEQYRITVFGAEGCGNYNRIMLSPVLAGEMTKDEIITHSKEWYLDQGITLHSGDPITTIDHDKQCLTSLAGTIFSYDKLVLATGSQPIIPTAAKNTGLSGICSFRNLKDVDQILSQASVSRHATVLGGGLLGLEAASALRQSGIEVTVVHRGQWLMNRQLDECAGKLLQNELEARGIKVLLNAEAIKFSGESSDCTGPEVPVPDTKPLTHICLDNNLKIATDMAVIAIGVSPNHSLAKSSGIECERGILVNHQLQSSHPNIYALGECTQFGKHTFGLVAPLWDQAGILADQLTEGTASRFSVKPCATKLKVSGINLFSAGEFIDAEDTQSLTCHDPKQNSYRKLLFREQKLVGVVLYGLVHDGNWYFDLIQQQKPVQHMVPDLIFGKQYCSFESTPGSSPRLNPEPASPLISQGTDTPPSVPKASLATGVIQ